MLRVVTDESTREDSPSMLDEIVREGARRMLAAALEAEIDGYIEAHADERDERCRFRSSIIPPWCRKSP